MFNCFRFFETDTAEVNLKFKLSSLHFCCWVISINSFELHFFGFGRDCPISVAAMLHYFRKDDKCKDMDKSLQHMIQYKYAWAGLFTHYHATLRHRYLPLPLWDSPSAATRDSSHFRPQLSLASANCSTTDRSSWNVLVLILSRSAKQASTSSVALFLNK